MYSAICCPAFSRRETVSSAALSAVTISTRLSALSAVKAFRRLTSFSILRDIFSLLVSRSERCFSSSASFCSVSAFCAFFSSAAACLFPISSAAAASETPSCSASACRRSKDWRLCSISFLITVIAPSFLRISSFRREILSRSPSISEVRRAKYAVFSSERRSKLLSSSSISR